MRGLSQLHVSDQTKHFKKNNRKKAYKPLLWSKKSIAKQYLLKLNIDPNPGYKTNDEKVELMKDSKKDDPWLLQMRNVQH